MGRLTRILFDPWAWFGIFLGLVFVAIVAFAPASHANTSNVTIEGTSHECMRYNGQNMTLFHITAFNHNGYRIRANYTWLDDGYSKQAHEGIGRNSGSYLNIWVAPGHTIEQIKVEVDGDLIFYRVKPFHYKEKCR